MSQVEKFVDHLATWAAREPSVQALVLIGSRVRPADDRVWRADAHSDWDFQIITSQPQRFADAAWTSGLAGMEVRAYAARIARIGGLPKVNAIFAGAEADFVILPGGRLRLAKFLVALGAHRHSAWLRRGLQDLAVVIRPGWKFLKGAAAWEPFYQRVVAEVADPRLDAEAVRGLAEGFVCDSVWARRKLERGELLAVQRMLHRELAETNFRLLHELKLRRGERSFPEARRIECVGGGAVESVSVDATLDATALRAALEKSAATCRELVHSLVGNTWRWPDVSS